MDPRQRTGRAGVDLGTLSPVIDSANRRGRGRHVTLPATVLLLGALLAGCSDDAGTEPLAAEPADPTPTEADPAAEVRAAYLAYTRARIASENQADPSPARFEGIARGGHVERQLNKVRKYAESNLVRVGEPAYTDIEVAVDGAAATVAACLDEDGWGARLDGEDLAPPDNGPVPTGAALEQDPDGSWVVVDIMEPEDKEC